MIGMRKSPLPPGVTIKSENDYRRDPVYALLRADCHDKCYICEQSLTSAHVEHIIPHKGDDALKYNWNNILLSCGHCNGTKLAHYDGIIDPTKVDPEKLIKQTWDADSDITETIVIQKIAGGSDVDITVDLLNAVYNKPKTPTKKLECQCLKNLISNEISWLYQKIDEYKADQNDNTERALEQMLADSSPFAAFKRDIIRDDPVLSEVFLK